jgi:hypothetical protein
VGPPPTRRPKRRRPPPQGGRRVRYYAIVIGLALIAPSASATIIEKPPDEPGLPTAPETLQPFSFRTRLIQVGPSRPIKLPSQAAALARTGDVIEIDPEAYVGDVAVWTADNLTIRGVGGGRAKLLAAGQSAENKATWVIKGRNAYVENIEFAEAVATNGNGAGIRAEGINLTVVNCYFHDNQEGILSALNTTTSRISIEDSEFDRDGGNGGYSHEIYISNIAQLIVRGSYFHHGRVGHLIKSRAQRNLIAANRITDEADGSASYEIDLPNGGLNIVMNNVIEQSALTQNSTMLENGLEGTTNPIQELHVVNNTFVNDLGRGDFIRIRGPVPAQVANNIFVGGGNVLVGPGALKNNLLAAGPGGSPHIEQPLFRTGDIAESGTRFAVDAGFLDSPHYDYRLKPDSPAIGVGADPGSAGPFSLAPAVEYVHPLRWRPISPGARIDIGAYQFNAMPMAAAR